MRYKVYAEFYKLTEKRASVCPYCGKDSTVEIVQEKRYIKRECLLCGKQFLVWEPVNRRGTYRVAEQHNLDFTDNPVEANETLNELNRIADAAEQEWNGKSGKSKLKLKKSKVQR